MFNLEVFLLQDLKNQGKKGEIITVKEGYARNYLIPKKIAKKVDAVVLAEKKSKDESMRYNKQQELLKAQQMVKFLNGKTVVVKAKSGSEGRLFGTVTSKDVFRAIKDAFDVTIDKKKLVLPEIKQFGIYEFQVKVYSKNIAKMKVDVKQDL